MILRTPWKKIKMSYDFSSSSNTAGKSIKQDMWKTKHKKSREEKCNTRHLKIGNFVKNNCKSQFRLKVLILAPKKVNHQDKVNSNITMLILKHDTDITTFIDEVNSLKLVMQSLAVQLVNKETRIESTIENTDKGG